MCVCNAACDIPFVPLALCCDIHQCVTGPTAATFPGSGNAYATMNTALGTAPNTFMVWVKIAAGGGRMIFAGQYANSGAINYEMHTSGRPRVYWDSGGKDWIVTSVDLRTGNWEHVAFVRDTTGFKFYQNGVLKSSTSGAGSSTPAGRNSVMWIGRDKRGSGSPQFQGDMAYMRFFSTTLLEADISAEMNSALCPVRAGLLAAFTFSGEGIADCTGSIGVTMVGSIVDVAAPPTDDPSATAAPTAAASPGEHASQRCLSCLTTSLSSQLHTIPPRCLAMGRAVQDTSEARPLLLSRTARPRARPRPRATSSRTVQVACPDAQETTAISVRSTRRAPAQNSPTAHPEVLTLTT